MGCGGRERKKQELHKDGTGAADGVQAGAGVSPLWLGLPPEAGGELTGELGLILILVRADKNTRT